MGSAEEVKDCAKLTKLVMHHVLIWFNAERYRSGHNGADSKSDGWGNLTRGFESRPLRRFLAPIYNVAKILFFPYFMRVVAGSNGPRRERVEVEPAHKMQDANLYVITKLNQENSNFTEIPMVLIHPSLILAGRYIRKFHAIFHAGCEGFKCFLCKDLNP